VFADKWLRANDYSAVTRKSKSDKEMRPKSRFSPGGPCVRAGLVQVLGGEERKPPPTAYAAVMYCGYWCLIYDRDQTGETTFAVVIQLARSDSARQELTREADPDPDRQPARPF
jgi:hypothetical protein